MRSTTFLIVVGLSTTAIACDHPAAAGDRLSMNYVGTIDASSQAGVPNSKFDSSYDRNQAFDFTLGQGEVISSWDKGLLGVCPGDSKVLIIPPEDGYGDEGAGADIPGGATLNFQVSVEAINDEHVASADDAKEKVNNALLRGKR